MFKSFGQLNKNCQKWQNSDFQSKCRVLKFRYFKYSLQFFYKCRFYWRVGKILVELRLFWSSPLILWFNTGACYLIYRLHKQSWHSMHTGYSKSCGYISFCMPNMYCITVFEYTAVFTANPFPVMTTGISLSSNSHREFPVMNTGSLQWERGFPVMKTGFSLCGKLHRENPVLALYWPCKGLQCTPNQL